MYFSLPSVFQVQTGTRFDAKELQRQLERVLCWAQPGRIGRGKMKT